VAGGLLNAKELAKEMEKKGTAELILEMQAVKSNFETLDVKSLVMRVHFGAQLYALKRKFKGNQYAFEALVESEFGIGLSSAYRYMCVSQLVDDYPVLLHCAPNWQQLHAHATKIRKMIEANGMADRFRNNKTDISFEPAPQQVVNASTPSSIFQGDEITAKDMGIEPYNVKYAGVDWMEHDTVVTRVLKADETKGAVADKATAKSDVIEADWQSGGDEDSEREQEKQVVAPITVALVGSPMTATMNAMAQLGVGGEVGDVAMDVSESTARRLPTIKQKNSQYVKIGGGIE